jgi:putative ABC transport system permease protein
MKMLGYYFALALASLKRNVGLTTLMMAAIAVGLGASMTVLIVYRAMAGNPIPGKAHELYAVQIDNWGPDVRTVSSSARADGLQDQIDYADATALMRARAAKRQAAMYTTLMTVIPANVQLSPYPVSARATYADFFRMFDVPFLYGSPWTAADDAAHARVVVISNRLNQSLFGGGDSVGRHIRFAHGEYRVAGVIAHWQPVPRFYSLMAGGAYSHTEKVFLPFTTSVEDQLAPNGNTDCNLSAPGNLVSLKASDCVWIQFWAELPSAPDFQAYRSFLAGYARQQRSDGRFHWLARTSLRDVPQWLRYEGVVSHQVELMVLVAFGFFLVCLVNAAGLMLAKVMEQAPRIATRRAIGAARGAILMQYLTEAVMVGVVGALAGLLLTGLGLAGAGRLFSDNVFRMVHLGAANVAIEVALAIGATLLAALYPTWRATCVNPATQLKTR